MKGIEICVSPSHILFRMASGSGSGGSDVGDARMEKMKLFEGKRVPLRVVTFSLYRD